MEVLIAVFSFLLGAVALLAGEVAILNEILMPVEGLANDVQAVLMTVVSGLVN